MKGNKPSKEAVDKFYELWKPEFIRQVKKRKADGTWDEFEKKCREKAQKN